MALLARSLLLLAILMLPANPAAATATFTCGIEDRNLTLTLTGNIGHGDGAAIQIVEGTIKLKAVSGQYGAIEFILEPSHLAQHWAFEKELSIGLQTDEKSGVSVFLAIITRRTNSDVSDRYAGRYVLKVNGPKGTRELKGRIKSCDAG